LTVLVVVAVVILIVVWFFRRSDEQQRNPVLGRLHDYQGGPGLAVADKEERTSGKVDDFPGLDLGTAREPGRDPGSEGDGV